MKTILFAISLALLVLFSAISAFVGAGIMIYDLYSGGSNFMQGFNIFCLGSILFLVSVTSYMITKTLTNTEILADVMSKYIANEMAKEMKVNINPLQQLFGGGFPPGMNMGTGSIKLSSIDKDGNITPLGEREFNNPEELLKYRNEILNKAFGAKPGKKQIQDMSTEELKEEEKKAVDNQQFELAAAIRDVLNRRLKGEE